MYFDPVELHEELDQRFPDDWRVRLYFRDAEVSASLRRFTMLLAQVDEADVLFAETLGLDDRCSTCRERMWDRPVRNPSLTRGVMARVVDYVEAKPGRPYQPGRPRSDGRI